MEDGTNLNKHEEKNSDIAIFAKKGPNNVAININTYIAKYDFDIARKLKTDAVEKDNEESEDSDEVKPTEYEIRNTFGVNAILEVL